MQKNPSYTYGPFNEYIIHVQSFEIQMNDIWPKWKQNSVKKKEERRNKRKRPRSAYLITFYRPLDYKMDTNTFFPYINHTSYHVRRVPQYILNNIPKRSIRFKITCKS